MTSEVGHAYVALIPSAKDFAAKMQREIGPDVSKQGQKTGSDYSQQFTSSAQKGVSSKARGIFSSLGKAGLLAGAAGAVAAGKLLVDSVSVASDLGETMAKTGQIFGQQSMPALERFAAGAATAMGQSKQQALDAASTFAIFGKSAGLTGGKLVGFSTDLTALAGDLASFGNSTPQEAIDALGSALRGEAEPMRKYGVMLDDATLKAEAMRLGILKPVKDQSKILAYQARVTVAQKSYNDAVAAHGKDSIEAIKAQAALGTAQSGLRKATEGTIPPLTAQQKVLAAQSSIMKQTKDAQGDFGRTSAGLANQQRILSAQFGNLKAALGDALLPVFVSVATVMTEKVMPPMIALAQNYGPKLGNAFADLIDKADIGAMFSRLGAALSGVKWGDMTSGLSGIGDSLASVDWSKLRDAFGSGVSDTISVFSVVIGFAADHIDTLAKLLPVLVVAFAAYKAAQAASNLVALASIPLDAARIASNFALANANRALATQMAILNGVERTSLLTKLRSAAATAAQAAATVASTIAQKAAAGAARAWAAVQWLLNAAMTANPIGLIVAGIALLIAAVVIIVKKLGGWHETMRKLGAVFGVVWNAIKTAFSAIVSFISSAVSKVIDFVRSHWRLILGILLGPFGLAVALIAKHWNTIKGVVARGISAVVGFVRSLPGRARAALSALGGALSSAVSAAFSKARSTVMSAISAIVNAVKGLPGKLRALGGVFADAGRAIIRKFVDGLKNAAGIVSGIAGNVWSAVRGLLNNAIGKINSALEFRISVAGKGFTINAPDIPRLASGGRAMGATLAVIGEGAEPETVLPDSMLRGLLERTAAAAAGGGGGSAVFHLYDSDDELIGTMSGVADSRFYANRELAR